MRGFHWSVKNWDLCRCFLGLPPIHSDKHKEDDFSRVAPIHSLRSSIVHICLLFPQKQKAIIEIEKDIPEKNFLFLPSDIFHSISIWWLYVFCYYANKVVKCWDIQNNNVHHWQNMIKFGMKNVTEELLIISKRNSKQSMQKMFSSERRAFKQETNAWGWAAP